MFIGKFQLELLRTFDKLAKNLHNYGAKPLCVGYQNDTWTRVQKMLKWGSMKHGDGNPLPSHVPAALLGRGRGGDGLGTFPTRF